MKGKSVTSDFILKPVFQHICWKVSSLMCLTNHAIRQFLSCFSTHRNAFISLSGFTTILRITFKGYYRNNNDKGSLQSFVHPFSRISARPTNCRNFA